MRAYKFPLWQAVLAKVLLSYNVAGFASTFVLPAGGGYVGSVEYIYAEPGESIYEFAQRVDMGFNELLKANPWIDSAHILPEDRALMIPRRFRLPSIRQGIVVNLAEYRLYYFPSDENIVLTYPVGIGRVGWQTPLGRTHVVAKQRNPQWRPTRKLHAEAKRQGALLPDYMPSNKYNPLGRYALRLGWSAYLIHGTNQAYGIGMNVSAGCIRMFAQDIEELYTRVPVGTLVHVIDKKP
ncbi:MAG: hypothetical protein BGO90_05865 [Legionella sp. 40-6]|nr:L,D-transpeptidase family protein [Legionella sp.]OJY32973.1 MAG: hypothetical protein BGO90_05865 [Legionella sp. 40-6]